MKKSVLLLIVALNGASLLAQNFQDVVREAETEEQLDDICQTASLGFMSTPRDIEDAVNGILKTVGINSIGDAAFRLKDCSQINNAVAKILKDENGNDVRYVLYDPNLLQTIADQTNNSWSAKFILAHEIGHHIMGHSLNNGSSNHKYELDADYWAGRALSTMGATLEETLAATEILPERASSSHPARADRRARAEEGWNSIVRQKTITVRDEDISEIAKTMVANVQNTLRTDYNSLKEEDFQKNLKVLNLARQKYYKDYTEDIRYLEAICYTGMKEKSKAETAYINYLSIENLKDQQRIKQIVSLYVSADSDKSSFFQNPDVLFRIANEYYEKSNYEKAISYATQFQQFSDPKKDQDRFSKINQLIGTSEYERIMMDDEDKLENTLKRGYTAFENQEYHKAFDLLEKGLEANDSKSQLMIGQMYYHGWGTGKDNTKAFELLLKACQNGNAEAQFLVGMMYKDGLGTSSDLDKAQYWLSKSSNQGHSQATSALNSLKREIAERDANTKRRIEKEEERREESASEKLAMAISNGETYFNREMYGDAYQHLIEAAKAGHADSQQKVAWMLYKGKGVSRDKDTAIEWWRKAAKQGDVESINILTRLGEW